MASHTKQVPHGQSQLSAADQALVEFLAGPLAPLFPEVAGAKRQYPGAPEGSFLAAHLNGLSARPTKQKAFTDLLSPLWKVERGESLKVIKWRYARKVMKAYARLKRRIDRKGLARITKDGLVVSPKSSEGKAALAALLLYGYGKRRLSRIRQCPCCGAWFFAHLERQRFCSDREKRCQWKHYHNKEWRKQYRERNRMHQQAHRKRNPGRKG